MKANHSNMLHTLLLASSIALVAVLPWQQANATPVPAPSTIKGSAVAQELCPHICKSRVGSTIDGREVTDAQWNKEVRCEGKACFCGCEFSHNGLPKKE
jgi:hypothetical protein